jgi:hypothetical protein
MAESRGGGGATKRGWKEGFFFSEEKKQKTLRVSAEFNRQGRGQTEKTR